MRTHHLLGMLLLLVVGILSVNGIAAPQGEAAASSTEGPLDALGRGVLGALKAKDLAALEALAADREDLEACMESRARSLGDGSEAEILMVKGREEIERRFAPDRIRRFRAKQAENFAETLAAADWAKAQLVGIAYEVDVEAVVGLRMAQIDLMLRIEGREVRVKIDELIETPNGWLTVEDNPLRVRAD